MRNSRRRIPTLAAAALGAAGLVVAGCGQGPAGEEGAAARYPTESVEYVIPFDPGGESDVTARLQQQPLEDALGQSVVVSNRPGGGGAVGWGELATSTEPDGYSLMGANLPHIALQPLARDDAGYETEDINWAYIFESTPGALIVAEDSPYESLEDFVEAAKESPGELTVGGSGEFSANHMGTLAIEEAAGVDLTYVPFTGTGAASPALLGGQVDALMSYTTAALDLESEGARVLALAAEERSDLLPDTPTFTEQGYDIVQGAWRGVAVPPDTPDAITEKVAAAFEEVNNDPEVQQKMEELGFEIVNMGPQESQEFTQQRKAEARKLLEEFDLINQDG